MADHRRRWSAPQSTDPRLWRDLVNHAGVSGTTACSCAIKVAVRVADHARVRAAAIAPGKKVEHRLNSGWSKFEDHAVVGSAAARGAVEIARRIQDQTCSGLLAVGT